VVTRPVRRGEVIRWDQVRLDESSSLVRLRRQQDAM
jgi:predicted homoserine dehydrogenase-like protein